MRKGMIKAIAALFLLALVIPRTAPAEIEWTLKKQLNLEAAPRDIASSVDGKWLFVLTEGEILVYSQDDQLIRHIPIDKAFDHLTYSVPERTLIASSSTKKTIKIIQLDVIQHFSFEGLPFEGAKNAPVTLAVFSDYQ